MALHETELESEFEYEGEFEDEYEGEAEDFDLGQVVGGLLGEGEFEDEYEGEEEAEDFDLGQVVGGLLGEGEFEDESEEFFGSIARFVKKNAPILRQVAKIAAPMVGTAFGGPLGGALGNMAARALGESELELEYEDEAEEEYEDELEGEYEDEASHPMTESEALAEMMAAVAARAQSDSEAEAMIGAATVTVLSPRDRAELRRVLPYMVRASSALTRILRHQEGAQPAVRAVPAIVKSTARSLSRRRAAGRPINRRTAARVMSRHTRSVLGSPRRTTAVLRRNVSATSAIRRSTRRGRPYPPRRRVRRRRAYTYG
jgi:hypothetical protein